MLAVEQETGARYPSIIHYGFYTEWHLFANRGAQDIAT
jgi:hypothetical protein